MDRFGVTFTSDPRSEIQIDNFSNEEIIRQKRSKMILMDETGIASFVEIYNEQSTTSIEGKLSHVVQIDIFVCWHAKQSPYCVKDIPTLK